MVKKTSGNLISNCPCRQVGDGGVPRCNAINSTCKLADGKVPTEAECETCPFGYWYDKFLVRSK